MLRRPAAASATAIRRAYRRHRPQLVDRSVERALFGKRGAPDIPVHERVPMSDLNAEPGVRLLQETDPDVLLLLGCPIIEPPLLAVPRVTTVNLHLGIAPEYRGNHTIFFALSRGDENHLGLTLHHADPGVDTGEVIAHVRPALSSKDNEATIIAKGTELASDVIDEFLQAPRPSTRTAEGQRPHGLLFRNRDRTPRAEAQYLARRVLLRQRPTPRPGSIQRYWKERTTNDRGTPHST